MPSELKQIVDQEATKIKKGSIDIAAGNSKAYGFRLGAAFLFDLIDELVEDIKEEKKNGEEEEQPPVAARV